MNKANFGIIGMGVMGRSLAKNVHARGISISVYNRLTEAERDVIPHLVKEINAPNFEGFTNLSSFVNSLAKPRKILLMISAGEVVDRVLNTLLPYLSQNDIVIDGGNSHYKDTQRRETRLKQKKVFFFGAGISGGEQGALTGPSIMIGGSQKAYEQIRIILEAISARDKNNLPCVNWLGSDGCGHLVKTIHNGIEYGEMQLLAECYALLRSSYTNDEIANIFNKWNTTHLSSYLLEITAQILLKKEGDVYLLDLVLDKAGNKGTGSWSSQIALQLGVPASIINAAVTARYISALQEKRLSISNQLKTTTTATGDLDILALKKAYHFARIINHHQGFEVLKAVSNKNNWNLELSEVARIWTQGCIIKSQFMESLVERFKENNDLLSFTDLLITLNSSEEAVIKIINESFKQRTPIVCISNSYNYFISLSSNRSSANLIQAQRDAFGAHTYQRIDQSSSTFFTSNWTKNG